MGIWGTRHASSVQRMVDLMGAARVGGLGAWCTFCFEWCGSSTASGLMRRCLALQAQAQGLQAARTPSHARRHTQHGCSRNRQAIKPWPKVTNFLCTPGLLVPSCRTVSQGVATQCAPSEDLDEVCVSPRTTVPASLLHPLALSALGCTVPKKSAPIGVALFAPCTAHKVQARAQDY